MRPATADFASSQLVGATFVALVNVVAISIVGSPTGLHLLAEVWLTIAAGGLAAAPAWLWTRASPPIKARWFWLGYSGLCIAAMWGLVRFAEERQAVIALDAMGFETEGALRVAVTTVYVGLTGLGVPVGFALARFMRKRRWSMGLGLLIATGVIILGHVRELDEYEGVHAAGLWGCATLAGTLLMPLIPKLSKPVSERYLPALAGLFLIAALVFPPSNAVRLKLFEHDNSVGAWVFSSVWRPPADEAVRAPESVEAVPTNMTRVDQPIVVLLTIDAFRGDVLRDGAHDEQLPNFARLRDRGAHFFEASAPSSGTAVSLTSMFTGRMYSQLHWADHGNTRIRFAYPIGDKTPRFPELLKAAGIRTVGYISPPFVGSAFGLGRGFSEEILIDHRQHAEAAHLLEPMLAALADADGGPAFFYAHVMDAHEPYDRGRLKTGSAYERYLSELELIDAYIGRFMRILQTKHRGRGYLIIGADHGEAFDDQADGDHGENFHSKNVYEEMVHIPLIMWGPNIGAKRIAGRASLLDVGPSVVDVFGLAPPEGAVGRSLMPVILGQRDSVGHPVAAEARKKRAFYGTFGLKVIEDQRRKTVEVYDLKADPSESFNLYSSDNQDALRALGEARAWFERIDTANAPYRR